MTIEETISTIASKIAATGTQSAPLTGVEALALIAHGNADPSVRKLATEKLGEIGLAEHQALERVAAAARSMIDHQDTLVGDDFGGGTYNALAQALEAAGR